MDATDPKRLYSLSDAVEILGAKPAPFLQALSLIPALRHKRAFTIEDLANIDDVLKTQIVPQMTRKGEV